MTCDEALSHFGTKAEIARQAGVHRAVVQGWFERGTIPLHPQMKLEVASGGALLADVDPEFRRVVREAA